MIGRLVEVEDHLRKILFMIEIIIYKFGIKNISWRNSLSQFSVVTTKCIIYKWNIFFAPTLHRSAASHLTPHTRVSQSSGGDGGDCGVLRDWRSVSWVTTMIFDDFKKVSVCMLELSGQSSIHWTFEKKRKCIPPPPPDLSYI